MSGQSKIATREITLDNGLTLSISEDAMDDMELLDLLAQLDDGNGYAIPRVVEHLLGKEQKKKLYDAVRVNGRSKVTAVVDAMKEILDKLGETGKN